MTPIAYPSGVNAAHSLQSRARTASRMRCARAWRSTGQRRLHPRRAATRPISLLPT